MAKSMFEVEWISEQGGGHTILSEEVAAEDEGEAMDVAYDDYYFLKLISVNHLYDIEGETP